MGGTTTVQQPSPPAAPTTTSSIADWVQNYPAVFNLQQQYAPLEAQRQVDLANQFATPMGEAMKNAQAAMYPNETALSNSLTAQAQSGMNAGLSDWEKSAYQDTLRSQLGSNISSPIGADYLSRGMLQAQQQRQDMYRNMGLSIAGKQPIATAQTPATANYTAGFTPNSVMASNIQAYSPYASAYANMYGSNASLQGNVNTNNANLWSQGMQTGASMFKTIW